ncbi:hypothetical protein Tco_0299240, partial [Tanacetum coccineum]
FCQSFYNIDLKGNELITTSKCPGVLGGDTCEGYIFITARVFLEGTPVMGTYGFHYCPGVLREDTYDGCKQIRRDCFEVLDLLRSIVQCNMALWESRGELNGAKIAKWLEETLTLGLLIPLSRGSFDVLMGMDWLSKRKFGIVCHEKVVRIPLEGDEILRVHGERTQGVVKTLMNTKVEFHIDLVHGATSVVKSPYRLAPLEMQELSEQIRELKTRVFIRPVISVGAISSVRDKILATSSETSKVENAPAEMLRDLDQQMEKRADDGCTLWIKLYSKYEYEIRYHPGKANVVIEALSRKERVKPRRVRAMAMYLFKYGARGMILTAKVKALKQANVTRRTYLTV